MAQVSTIVALADPWAPMLTKQGISTALLARCRPRGEPPRPARRGSPPRATRRTCRQPSQLARHLVPPGAGRDGRRPSARCPCRRKESSTAFFSHWCVTQAPSIFSATRTSPRSSSLQRRLHRLAHRPPECRTSGSARVLPGGVDLGLELRRGRGVMRVRAPAEVRARCEKAGVSVGRCGGRRRGWGRRWRGGRPGRWSCRARRRGLQVLHRVLEEDGGRAGRDRVARPSCASNVRACRAWAPGRPASRWNTCRRTARPVPRCASTRSAWPGRWRW